MYIVPYEFAIEATPEALASGLLTSMEFRQDDDYLTGVKLFFDNGHK